MTAKDGEARLPIPASRHSLLESPNGPRSDRIPQPVRPGGEDVKAPASGLPPGGERAAYLPQM